MGAGEDAVPQRSALEAAVWRAAEGRMATQVGLVLGFDSGLLQALVLGGTPAEVARRAGTDPRMTEEWLRVMVVAGFADHTAGVFTPVEGFDDFVGDGSPATPAGAFVAMAGRDGRLRPLLAEALRTGAGLPWSVYEPEGSLAQDVLTAPSVRRDLLPRVLGAVPGLLDRLDTGVDVLEIGCGGGEALVVMASAYPQSRYTGYDLSADALERARRKAEAAHVDVRLEQRDAADLPADAVDLVLAVDTVHDLGRPLEMLTAARAALRADGVLVVCEPTATGDFDVDRHGDGAWQYYTSLAGCVPLSQGAGGPGLGSLWGRAGALPLLAEAGFDDVTAHDTGVGTTAYACRVRT